MTSPQDPFAPPPEGQGPPPPPPAWGPPPAAPPSWGGQPPSGAPGWGAPPSGPPGWGPPGGQPGWGSAPPGYGAPPPGYGYGRPAGTNGLAIAALVVAFLCSPAAIVMGAIARNQCRRTGQEGEGIATAGLVLGIVFTGFAVLLVGLSFLPFLFIGDATSVEVEPF